jgi:hypothetical protein
MKSAILTVIAACMAGGCAVVPPPRHAVYVGPPVVAVAPPVVAVGPPPPVVVAPAPVVVAPRPYWGYRPYYRRGWH